MWTLIIHHKDGTQSKVTGFENKQDAIFIGSLIHTSNSTVLTWEAVWQV